MRFACLYICSVCAFGIYIIFIFTTPPKALALPTEGAPRIFSPRTFFLVFLYITFKSFRVSGVKGVEGYSFRCYIFFQKSSYGLFLLFFILLSKVFESRVPRVSKVIVFDVIFFSEIDLWFFLKGFFFKRLRLKAPCPTHGHGADSQT